MAPSVGARLWNYVGGIQVRSGTGAIYSKSKAAGISVDSADSYQLKFGQNGSVQTVADLSSTQTLTNKTLSGAVFMNPGTKFCSTQFDAVTGTTGATLTNIVGLTGFTLVAAGVYLFTIRISGVSTSNSGMKLGLAYTTLTATSIESVARGFTAAAVAVQHSTTSTTGMTLFGQTAAVIAVEITGQLIVNAGGTVAVQAAQNAAHADTTSVYVGSSATFTRIS